MNEINLNSKVSHSKVLSSFITLLKTQKLNNRFLFKKKKEKESLEPNIMSQESSFKSLLNNFSLDFDQILIQKLKEIKALNNRFFLSGEINKILESKKYRTPSIFNKRKSSLIYSQLLFKQLQAKSYIPFFLPKKEVPLKLLKKQTTNIKKLTYELLSLRYYKKKVQNYQNHSFLKLKKEKNVPFYQDTAPFFSMSSKKKNLLNPKLKELDSEMLIMQKKLLEFYQKKKNLEKWQKILFSKENKPLSKYNFAELSLNQRILNKNKQNQKIITLNYPILLWNSLESSHYLTVNPDKINKKDFNAKNVRYLLYKSLKSRFEIFPSLSFNHFESNVHQSPLTSKSFKLVQFIPEKNFSKLNLDFPLKKESLLDTFSSNSQSWKTLKSNWFYQNQNSMLVGQRFFKFLQNLSTQIYTAFEKSYFKLLEQNRKEASKLFIHSTFKDNLYISSAFNFITSKELPKKRTRNKETTFVQKFRILKRKKILNKFHWIKEKEKRNRRFEKIFRTGFSAKAESKNSSLNSSKKEKNKIRTNESLYVEPSLNPFIEFKKSFYTKKLLKKETSSYSLLEKMDDKNEIKGKKFFLNNTSISKLKTRLKYKKKNHSSLFLNTYFLLNNQISHSQKNLPSYTKRIKNLESFKIIRISNTSLLKRLGFIFLQKKASSSMFTFFDGDFLSLKNSLYKKKDIVKNENLSMMSRLEKEKYLQKKRRRKKQKLITRRRKKRKRFFPRPVWLRFHLYKKFLSYRHPLEKSNFKEMPYSKLALNNVNSLFKFNDSASKIKSPFFATLKKGEFVDGKIWELKKKPIVKLTAFSPKAFSFTLKPSLKRALDFSTTPLNTKFFSNKISNFSFYKKERFENKIYRNHKQKWGLLNQDTPYFEKVMLKKMPISVAFPLSQNNEHLKISSSILSEFQRLCWKSYWLQTNLTPYIRRIENNFKQIKNIEKETSSLSFLKTWTTNMIGFHLFEILHPISSKFTSNDLFNKKTNSYDLMNKNINQTNTFKSSRINLKQSENVLWYFNIHNSLENGNFVSSFSNFHSLENIPEYNRILYERISEVIRNVKYNLNADGQASMKSYKVGRRRKEENLTNSSSFLKGLNHFIYDMFGQNPHFSKYSLFSTNSSMKPYGDMPTLRTLWAFNKTHLFKFKEKNHMKLLWTSLKQREQAKSNKTKKFFVKSFRKLSILKWNTLYLNSKTYQDTQKNTKMNIISNPYLDMSTAQKLRKIKDKSMNLGGFVHAKTYNHYLRHLKFKLKTDLIYKPKQFKPSKIKWVENQSSVITKPQTSMKSSLNYWWSTGQWNFQSFFLATNYAFPIEVFSQNENIKKDWFGNLNNLNFDPKFSKCTENSNLSFGLKTHFFTLCVFVFHLSICLSLMKIPEIRSVFKFHLLFFYKLGNSYFMVLYFIYDLLKNYQSQFIKRIHSIYNNLKKEKPLESERILMISTFNNKVLKEKMRKTNFSLKELQSFTIEKSEEKLDGNHFSLFTKKFIQKSTDLNLNKKSVLYNSSFLEWTLRFPGNRIFPISFQKIASMEKRKNLLRSPIFIYSFSKRGSTFFSTCLYLLLKYPMVFKFKMLLNDKKNKEIKKSMITFKKDTDLNKMTMSLTSLQSILSLGILYSLKWILSIGYGSLNVSYAFLLKILDVLESVMFIIYKFLEKPAELMVEWIAQIFIIEWASDITTFLPETFDVYVWNSMFKFSRNLRILNGNLLVNSAFSASLTTHSLGFLSSNTIGFLVQRRLWSFMELISDSVLKPDMDLMIRQKKGMIFWDIWAEILIQAAEKYNLNIPSLVSLKEEQELLIERLLQDSTFLTKQKSLLKGEQTQNFITPLIHLIKTERPTTLYYSAPIFNHQYNMSSLSNFIYKKEKTKLSLSSQKEKKNMLLLLPKLSSKSFKLVSRESEMWKNLEKNVWKRWSSNQYLTYQSRETDLFLDFHPPKSLVHLSYLKQYEPAQYALGSFICQIYSGLFSKQVSKNILIVGPQGNSKSLLIQALAGETEMKIMTDNANRYAMVQRGVAVGMKLLRDVFDAIALQTPCIFLMEDIHVIGEKRPMLISDDENAKMMQSSFGMEQEEVHERNQIMYQLSRHAINDYKRPYKGDFSSFIPTNSFTQDLFKKRKMKEKNSATLSSQPHPLPIDFISNQNKGQTEKESFFNPFDSSKLSTNNSLISRLQLSFEKVFAPPATSPFTILMMKEQKKLKPKKLVKEIPWGGFSTDQMLLVSKNNYSVRIKVALLADLAMSQFSVKLDMITDLLVIIDSVRSNRGFVVFATTHVPSILDPALRRPGRFDEMIYLPSLPNFMTRFDFLKLNLLNFSPTLDFMDYSLMTSHFSEKSLNHLVSKTKLLLFNTKVPRNTFHYSIYSPNQGLDVFLKEPILDNFKKPKYVFSTNSAFERKSIENKFKQTSKLNSKQTFLFKQIKGSLLHRLRNPKYFLTELSDKNLKKSTIAKYTIIPSGPSRVLSFAYSEIGHFIIRSYFVKDPTSFGTITLSSENSFSKSETFLFKALYGSRQELKAQTIQFFAQKVAEFFIGNSIQKNTSFFSESNSFHEEKERTTFSSQGFWNISGSSQWHSATAFVFSILQKRYLYNKNLLVSKMLSFDNLSSLKEPPSPPQSTIFMPLKNYENLKRTERDFQQKGNFSINEKIKKHQQQRFMKQLYRQPVQQVFHSEMVSKRQTVFSSASKELGYLDSFMQKPTSTSSYYQNRLLTRQRFSLINQWWNAQLAEHNAETTYLSDVDWRTIFVSSSENKKIKKESSYKSLSGEFLLDFPDADQHYNPRQRRWFLHSNSWNYWLSFEQILQYEIYYHFIMESFNSAFIYLDQQRELLDAFASLFLQKGYLKEMDFITFSSRFYVKNI
uniref:Cell division protein n=1 Tax=Rotundella rotunda TaxID=1357779 RepID=A0A140GIM6_9CHLO|nr:cell division protein [Rotundella rotunda]